MKRSVVTGEEQNICCFSLDLFCPLSRFFVCFFNPEYFWHDLNVAHCETSHQHADEQTSARDRVEDPSLQRLNLRCIDYQMKSCSSDPLLHSRQLPSSYHPFSCRWIFHSESVGFQRYERRWPEFSRKALWRNRRWRSYMLVSAGIARGAGTQLADRVPAVPSAETTPRVL